MAIKVDKVLFEGSSEYQRCGVYKPATYGTMMTLDGVIQSTERDEHAYVRARPAQTCRSRPRALPYQRGRLTRSLSRQHEMMAHIPMFVHPNPQHVCIIGGGDGGVMREVVRHSCVVSADNCDIDGVVVEQSKIHLKHREPGPPTSHTPSARHLPTPAFSFHPRGHQLPADSTTPARTSRWATGWNSSRPRRRHTM